MEKPPLCGGENLLSDTRVQHSQKLNLETQTINEMFSFQAMNLRCTAAGTQY
jgi:hypothetical protein